MEEKHYCTQEEAINRMNLILVGNGHPEDGLAFKVLHMAKTHETILDNLKDINENIKELSTKYDNAINASKTAVNAIENYKKEVAQFEKGKEIVMNQIDKTMHNRYSKSSKVLTALGIIIAGLMLCITTYNSFKKDKVITENRIEIPNNHPLIN